MRASRQTPVTLFVDTSGWAAPVLRNTPNYEEMATFAQRVASSARPLVTTNYVLTEVVALLTSRSRLTRPMMLQFLQQIRQTVYVVHIDRQADLEAWTLLDQYADKNWSLVDAVSFVVMRQLGLQEAFTSDQHFVQAGFARVPS